MKFEIEKKIELGCFSLLILLATVNLLLFSTNSPLPRFHPNKSIKKIAAFNK